MEGRNIQHGSYGWYEKGAMKKIEQLPYRQQASCKVVYIAICSLSAKQQNSHEVSGWMSQIASFASVCTKTVQRCLPSLKSTGIIDYLPQDRKSNGKFDKVIIWLTDNTLTEGHLQESSKKVGGKLPPSTVQYINKEINKETNKEIVPIGTTTKVEHGNKEVNGMLVALKKTIGIDAFVDSSLERNLATHCVGLIGKIGKDEFVRRLGVLMSDPFHAKNCNKIKYVYNNIKGFIEPKVLTSNVAHL